MRLGKALATGVAEERPQSYESVETFESFEGGRRPTEQAAEPETAVPAEEVPVAR